MKAATGKALLEWEDHPSDAIAFWPQGKMLLGHNGVSLAATTLPPAKANTKVKARDGLIGGGIGRIAAGVAVPSKGTDYAYLLHADNTQKNGAIVVRGDLQMELRGHTGTCFAVAWSPDGKTVATGGDDGKIVVWSGKEYDGKRDLQKDYSEMREIPTEDSRVRALAFAPDGKTLYSGSASPTAITGWDLTTGKSTFHQTIGGPAVTSLSFSPNGQSLLVATGNPYGNGTAEGRVEIWQMGTEPRR